METATIISVIIAAVLVALSGLFSGLNLGLMSFCDADLQIVIEGSPDKREVADAIRLRPLRSRGNLLLCTLLLGNTLVNALIAILLADLSSGVIGAICTTGLIVVFGEIIPQSVCSRHALYVGARSVPIVYLFLLICLPIAYPISLVLDKMLGREMGATFTKTELLALIRLNMADPERAKEVGLTSEEAEIVKGALTWQDERVDEAMTPLNRVVCVPFDTVLDQAAFQSIVQHNHSRMPVYEGDRTNIVALLYSKDLLANGYERRTPLREVLEAFNASSRVVRVLGSSTVGHAFQLCKKRRTHMLVVMSDLGEGGVVQGILTMEDILEKIIQQDITDEFDEFDRDGKRHYSRPDPLKFFHRICGNSPRMSADDIEDEIISHTAIVPTSMHIPGEVQDTGR
eukprot:TRINITY_DN19841_c0_g1_i1.p1 TRINITY_DN19841_c0_g1~~TRINITY_DN19841_c0_g1_i1.p1  ORF type:complete len:400 (+),score=56.80 TRINITY_DN19841_c0_g1_i1:71-1270(+)